MAHESSNDLNTPMILVIGLVSAVATFSIILGLIGMYHTVRVNQEEEEIVVEYADPQSLLDRQLQNLREPAMIDAGTGQVRIPIDQAMALTVARLEGDRSDDGVRSSKFAQSDKIAASPTATEPGEGGSEGEQGSDEAGDAADAAAAADGGDNPANPAGRDGEANDSAASGG